MDLEGVTHTNLEIDWAAQTVLPIEFGGREHTLDARAYQGKDKSVQALVLTSRGMDLKTNAVALVRVHSGCITGDIFHSLRCDCYQQLQEALSQVVASDNGILVYLPYQEGRGIGIVSKIAAYAKQDQGLDTVDANLELGKPVDAREYGFASAILADLGVKRLRLLTNNPAKVEALEKFGLDVVEQVPVRVKPGAHNKAYLDAKRSRLDHDI